MHRVIIRLSTSAFKVEAYQPEQRWYLTDFIETYRISYKGKITCVYLSDKLNTCNQVTIPMLQFTINVFTFVNSKDTNAVILKRKFTHCRGKIIQNENVQTNKIPIGATLKLPQPQRMTREIVKRSTFFYPLVTMGYSKAQFPRRGVRCLES